jgi:uncharacterized protein (UPF0147 family)
MKNLDKLSFSDLLDLLIDEETTDIEKDRVKKFILNNFCESPSYAYNQAMEDLKNISDDNLVIANSRLCARDIAECLLENMETMSFDVIENIAIEKISAGRGLCNHHR